MASPVFLWSLLRSPEPPQGSCGSEVKAAVAIHCSLTELQDASVYDTSKERAKNFETFDKCAMKVIDKMKRRFNEGYVVNFEVSHARDSSATGLTVRTGT